MATAQTAPGMALKLIPDLHLVETIQMDTDIAVHGAVANVEKNRGFSEFGSYIGREVERFLRTYGRTAYGAALVGGAVNSIFLSCQNYVTPESRAEYVGLYRKSMFEVGKRIAQLSNEPFPNTWSEYAKVIDNRIRLSEPKNAQA